jgi:hypothetical protein
MSFAVQFPTDVKRRNFLATLLIDFRAPVMLIRIRNKFEKYDTNTMYPNLRLMTSHKLQILKCSALILLHTLSFRT